MPKKADLRYRKVIVIYMTNIKLLAAVNNVLLMISKNNNSIKNILSHGEYDLRIARHDM
jgi:hypothetical protein